MDKEIVCLQKLEWNTALIWSANTVHWSRKPGRLCNGPTQSKTPDHKSITHISSNTKLKSIFLLFFFSVFSYYLSLFNQSYSFQISVPRAALFSARVCQNAFVSSLNPVISWLGCGEHCLQTAAWHEQRESDARYVLHQRSHLERICQCLRHCIVILFKLTKQYG